MYVRKDFIESGKKMKAQSERSLLSEQYICPNQYK